MIEALVAIVCGLVLAAQILPGGSMLKAIMPFKTIIGIVAIVIGILHIISVLGIALIAGGLVLTVKLINKVPVVGPYLKQAGRFLAKFQIIIGVLLCVMGIIKLIHFF